MSLTLSNLRPASGARTPRTRVGRGHGSGHVKTSGRGTKGQKARTGGKVPAYFEGGQNRFSQRMPYVNGFKNPFRKEYATVNLRQLGIFADGNEVTAETLLQRGLLRGREAKGLLKILGDGTLDRALNVTAHKFSESARAKIEAAGGKVTVIELKTYPKTKRAKKLSPPEATPALADA
jgi:large subunit ribosomal protein L15